jgi:endonuclease/exonuclease/phosphatase family metal-dependent hydrolase
MRLILCALTVACFCSLPAPASEVILKVMSWNCHKGSTAWNDADQVTQPKAEAQKMYESGADVIGLQEVRAPHRLTFKSELERLSGKPWYLVEGFTPGQSLSSMTTNGVIILSRYPLQADGLAVSEDVGPTDGGRRIATRAKIVVNGVAVNVFNVHLDYYNESYRTQNLNELMAWCANPAFAGPKIVTGDFNSSWNSTWIATMKTKYADTWQDYTGSASSAPSSHQAGWRPDYVFRSLEGASKMRVAYTQVWQLPFENAGGLSDHRPVIAHIGIISASSSLNAAPTVASGGAAKADGATPATVSDTNAALSVLGADDGGEAALTYNWAATSIPTGATAPTFSGTAWTSARKNCTATFSKAGAYTLQATIKDSAGLQTTSSVSITVNQTLATVSVSPASVSVATGSTQQFIASGRDQFGAAKSAAYTWSVTGGGSITSSGLFTATTIGGPFQVKAQSGTRFATASVTVTSAASLPAPWQGTTVAAAGNAVGSSNSYASGVFTLKGTSHGGVYESTDGVRFVNQTLTGDGTITVRIKSLSSTSISNSVAGLMFRESLNAGARTVTYTMLQAPGSAAPIIKLRSRTTTSGISSVAVGTSRVTLPSTYYPCWLKLSRVGNVFTASYCQGSVQGTYTTHGQTTLALPATLTVGIFAGHEDAATGNTATVVVDNVTVTAGAPKVLMTASYAGAGSQPMVSVASTPAMGGGSHGRCGLGGGIALLFGALLMLARPRRGDHHA